ncbi:hypothetical protein J7426_22190 [Tropicibacter sp. R16_0]|uniref:hypothetical protein n=1 Tax=Tropicibacter sp. R16_0 TaxID=2821102 RepID=UPI001AD97A50|nr:hypothetical protein [Tropicibacter sp. R16_0]MBO9452989.1 hypothetical protein [Tropicibacter sp. R16_0]
MLIASVSTRHGLIRAPSNCTKPLILIAKTAPEFQDGSVERVLADCLIFQDDRGIGLWVSHQIDVFHRIAVNQGEVGV